MREAENVLSHLRELEMSLIDSLRSRAWSGVMEKTIKVVAFVLPAASDLRKLVVLMYTPVAKPIASLMVMRSSAGSAGRTCTGRLWMA
jgi:hypothetical protein